jgi:hypothetical protein
MEQRGEDVCHNGMRSSLIHNAILTCPFSGKMGERETGLPAVQEIPYSFTFR